MAWKKRDAQYGGDILDMTKQPPLSHFTAFYEGTETFQKLKFGTKDEYVKDCKHKFKKDDGSSFEVFGKTDLNARLIGIAVGTRVMVQYMGSQPVLNKDGTAKVGSDGKQWTVHAFEVYEDDGTGDNTPPPVVDASAVAAKDALGDLPF